MRRKRHCSKDQGDGLSSHELAPACIELMLTPNCEAVWAVELRAYPSFFIINHRKEDVVLLKTKFPNQDTEAGTSLFQICAGQNNCLVS